MQDEREDEEPKTEEDKGYMVITDGGKLKEKCEENKWEGYDIEEFCFNISIFSKG